MPTKLFTFFNPKSLAVIGASRTETKLGTLVLRNIIESGFKGHIYPVNPNADKILGLDVYKSVQEIPHDVDMAVVAVPASIVNPILEELGNKGIFNVVLLSAGYKEIGPEGEKLESALKKIVHDKKLNLLGPNCLGFINKNVPINATFGEPIEHSGNLRLVTQSGAIASAMVDWCNTNNLGVSEFITIGNKVALDETHLLEYFSDNNVEPKDSELSTLSPIGMYLESVVQGTQFLEKLKKVTTKNPVFILKPGKTEASKHAMMSHTGAIAGEDSVLDSMLKEAGAIRCYTLEDLFDLSKGFSWENLPNGPSVAVVSNAGGPGVISADAIVENDLKIAQFTDEEKNKLKEALPRESSILNPVDVLGDALADRYATAIDIALSSDATDSLLVLLTPQIMTQIEQTAEVIVFMAEKHKKPVFCSFIGGKDVAKGEQILNKHKIPSYRYPERAIFTIGRMWQYASNRNNQLKKPVQKVKIEVKDPQTLINIAKENNQHSLDAVQSDQLLKFVGVNSPETTYVSNLNEAVEFAKNVGWPVVLKLTSPGLLHKNEIGGVEVNIFNESLLDEAWHRLERKIEQLDADLKKSINFQIQKEILSGVEVIVGVKEDSVFGPILLFGAGGSTAELILDRNIHSLPINKDIALELINNSKISKLLHKHLEKDDTGINKLADLLVTVSNLYLNLEDVKDLEINPVIVTRNDVWAVDTKVVITENPPKPKAPALKEAKLIKHEVLATKFNYFEFETQEDFSFIPGQYVSVKVAPTAIRAYSIATQAAPNRFSLLVDTRPGGPGSKFFEALKEGDVMNFLGPFGTFIYKHEDTCEELVFMGTGSGISPLRCMVEEALIRQKCTKPVKLYFGLTHDKEVFWKDYFENLQKQYPNFKFEIALFEPSENWTGHKGFITDLLKNDIADTSSCSAYLCGHPNMMEGATKLLLETGCSKEKIYQERFN